MKPDPETFIPPCFTEQRELSLGTQGDFELLVHVVGDHIYNTIIRNNAEGVQAEFPSNQSLKEMRRVIDKAREMSAGKEAFEDAAFFRDVVASINDNSVEP